MGDIPDWLSEPEWDSLEALIETPCATDGDFVAKLRRLAERQEWMHGNDWISDNPEPFTKAIARHLGIKIEA